MRYYSNQISIYHTISINIAILSVLPVVVYQIQLVFSDSEFSHGFYDILCDESITNAPITVNHPILNWF